jgi:hypothetical protein
MQVAPQMKHRTPPVSPETKPARKRRGRELIRENLEPCAEDAELTIVHRYLQRRKLAIGLSNTCCKVGILKFRDLNSSARVILTRATAQPDTDFSVAEVKGDEHGQPAAA